ncbi:MAG: sensor histidine kinase [Candidatus Hodarchaeota archaeon]
MSYPCLESGNSRKLKEFITRTENENLLIKKVLAYAKTGEFTRYTSTLEEAWRISIAGLTESLCKTIDSYHDCLPELTVDDDYEKDPAASFGILEAQLHRSRGITLALFLALMKYYRQSYIDLVCEADEFEPELVNFFHLYVERFFDRVEIGFTSEWAQSSKDALMDELREKNRGLTNEKNKFLTIFASLKSPVILLGSDYEVANLNQAAVETFIGPLTPGTHYYQDEKEKPKFKWLDEIIEEYKDQKNVTATFEKDIDTLKGQRTFEIKFQKMLDVSEKFSGVTLIMNDVTARIEFDNLRKRFVSTVSHELRTPITGIGLSIKNLEKYKDSLTPEKKDMLISMIAQSSSVLSNMIEDLLILSRLDAQKIILQKTGVNVSRLLDGVLFELESKRAEKSIEIIKDVEPSTEIVADEVRLSQVLRILVDNAIKYSNNEGKVMISVKPGYTGNHNPANIDGVLIEVKDNGIGIKDGDKENMFQRFFRSTEVKNIQGTGLGLSIAKELVNYHGGTINFESKHGEGTTFFIFFPKN